MLEGYPTTTFWARLLEQVRLGVCVPFLGAGACAGVLPTANELAKQWAERYEFPMNDCISLDRVAQFIEITRGRAYLNRLLEEEFSQREAPNEPHGTLAVLPFNMYVTTNYDDFMGVSLEQNGKSPVRLILPRRLPEEEYFKDKSRYPKYKLEPHFSPSTERPVVFHPHGHATVPDSIVITETDYYKSLTSFVNAAFLFPPQILSQLASSSFLFIGYSLADWSFRLLFYALHNRLGHLNSAVMFLPEGTEKQLSYTNKYLNRFTPAEVYFGKAKEFAEELRFRWDDYIEDSAPLAPSA